MLAEISPELNAAGPFIVLFIAIVGFSIALPMIYRKRKSGERFVRVSVERDLAAHGCRLVELRSQFTGGDIAKQAAIQSVMAIVSGGFAVKNYNVFQCIFLGPDGCRRDAVVVAHPNSIWTEIISSPPKLTWDPALDTLAVDRSQ